jgi:hypothetical protein
MNSTATVMDANPETLNELVTRTKTLCGELFQAAGWKILPGETVTEGEQLAHIFTYKIEPAGELTIERSPGYAGDDDFVFVGIVGWSENEENTEGIKSFLTSLAAAQKYAFPNRVNAWV